LLDNQGGLWHVNIDTNFADFATVSMSGKRAPWNIEQGPNERNREENNIVTNVNLGKLLPQNGKLISL
jgi:cell surface protein SprA